MRSGIWILLALLLVLSMACGSAKDVSELPYRKRKAFEHYYFEANKQKVLASGIAGCYES